MGRAGQGWGWGSLVEVHSGSQSMNKPCVGTRRLNIGEATLWLWDCDSKLIQGLGEKPALKSQKLY